jgi:hypothetical protein
MLRTLALLGIGFGIFLIIWAGSSVATRIECATPIPPSDDDQPPPVRMTVIERQSLHGKLYAVQVQTPMYHYVRRGWPWRRRTEIRIDLIMTDIAGYDDIGLPKTRGKRKELWSLHKEEAEKLQNLLLESEYMIPIKWTPD